MLAVGADSRCLCFFSFVRSLCSLSLENGSIKNEILSQMDGWMTCDFTSFLKVFQSYQDDVRMIMKV